MNAWKQGDDEIYTVEKPSLFWDKIVPVFLILGLGYIIIRMF